MSRLTEAEIATLEKIQDANAEFKTAEVRELAVARREARERIAGYKVIRDTLAAQAHLDGISKRQIGLVGLGTTSPKTYNEAIDAGLRYARLAPKPEAEATIAQSAPVAERLTATVGGGVAVTLQPDEMNKYAAMLVDGHQPEEREWSFYLDAGVLQPERNQDDATWSNPVVQVVNASPDLKAEVITFLEAQN